MSPDIETVQTPTHDEDDEKIPYESMQGHFEEVEHVRQGLHQRHIQMVGFVASFGVPDP